MTIRNRLTKLRSQFAIKGIDGMLVAQPENRCYLSGFSGSAGYLFITSGSAVLATDFRYTEQAGKQAPEYEAQRIGSDFTWLSDLLARLKIERLGFESDFITYALFEQFKDQVKDKQPRTSLVPVTGLLENIRSVKETGEIDSIARAAGISDAAFAHIAERLQPGMTEKAAAWEIEKFMRENGSEVMPFDVIVAAGPASAMPHHHPGDRPIQAGEPVVLDLGARVEGYCSDMTRTICLGEPDATFRKIYDIVLGAQLTAISLIKDGITGEQADRCARLVIQEAGYGDAFGHSLGHGIGLAAHEFPRLGPNSKDILAGGMVFTVEPGIYVTGWGGVRIEDDVCLQDSKLKIITSAPKT